MSLQRFLEYAEAFEHAYASGQWQELASYFTDDAVYEIRMDDQAPVEYRGREAVLDYLASVTEGFDKRFASRKLLPFEAPREAEDGVWLYGAAVYTMADGARCHLVMEEQAIFSGERIARLVDYVTPGAVAEVQVIRQRYPEAFAGAPVPA